MSRKRICGSCGKIIDDKIQRCSCQKDYFKTYKKSEKNIEADKFLRSNKWRTKRERILQRDNHLCQRCLIKYNILNSEDLTVHHILSRENYPELKLVDENLITLCRQCNSNLGTSDKLDFDFTFNEEDFVL